MTPASASGGDRQPNAHGASLPRPADKHNDMQTRPGEAAVKATHVYVNLTTRYQPAHRAAPTMAVGRCLDNN